MTPEQERRMAAEIQALMHQQYRESLANVDSLLSEGDRFLATVLTLDLALSMFEFSQEAGKQKMSEERLHRICLAAIGAVQEVQKRYPEIQRKIKEIQDGL